MVGERKYCEVNHNHQNHETGSIHFERQCYQVYCNQLQIKNVTKLSVSLFQSVGLKTILRLNHQLGIYFYKVYYISCIYNSQFSYLPLFYPFDFKFSGYDHTVVSQTYFFLQSNGNAYFFFTQRSALLFTHKIKLFMKKL